MSKKIALLLTLCLCLTLSCDKNKYQIVLTPQGDSIKREITCWREGDNNKILEFPQPQLDQIAQAYNVPSPKAQAKKYSFAGTFTEHTPNDIGGNGSYLYATTSIGNSFYYSERFNGNDDLQLGLQERQHAVNELVDLIIGWFQSEMRWEWNFGKLKNFLDRDFRWDMQNLCLYGWSANLTDKKDEMAFRAVQYLSERNYFTPSEFFDAFNELVSQNANHYDKFIALIRQMAAQKMGYTSDQNLSKSMAFLSNTASAEKSLEKYLRNTKQYKTLLKQWENDKKTKPDSPKPEPRDVIRRLADKAVGAGFVSFPPDQYDELEVLLNCSVEPLTTNGKWNSEKRILTWSQGIEKSKSKLPTYLFAIWVIPNETFQKTHFGQVVLQGEFLGQYTLWYNNLTSTQKKEWNTFLESLAPDSGLKKQLTTQFKYPSGADPGPENPGQWVSYFAKVLYENGKPSGVTATMPTTQSTQSTQ